MHSPLKDNTTIGDLIRIQAQQLEEWAALLKPEVYLALRGEVTKETSALYYKEENHHLPAVGHYDRIPRGTDIYCLLANRVRPQFYARPGETSTRKFVNVTP